MEEYEVLEEMKESYNSFKFLIFLIFLTSCCRTNPQLPANKAEADTIAENLIDYNRLCIEDERREIEAYIDSVQKVDNITFELTDYGCYLAHHPEPLSRHPERSEGSNSLSTITSGDRVSIAYSLELLDGTICSQTTGKAKSFTVGKREVVKGLDIAMEGKCVGDEFEIIIPYNLAYGVTGDRGCVPPMTPVLYKVLIINN